MEETNFSSINAQIEYYDQRWSSEEYANRLFLQRTITILDYLKRTGLEYPKILDLGCGTGHLTAILAQFGPCTGIELSPAAVELAQKKYPTARFFAGNLFELPVESAAYDVIVSQEVIEHVDDQPKFLEIAAEYLKPHGYLILTTPNAYIQTHRTKEDLDKWGMQPIENWVTPWGLKRFLRKHFRVLAMNTIILGYGTRGLCRIVNSVKIQYLVKGLGLTSIFDTFRRRLHYGLHIVAFCQLSD